MNPKSSSSTSNESAEKVPIKTSTQSSAGVQQPNKPINKETPAEDITQAPAITKPGEVIQPTSDSAVKKDETPIEIDPSAFSHLPVPQETVGPVPIEMNAGPHANLQNAPVIVSPKRPRGGLKYLVVLLFLLLLLGGSAFAYTQYIAPERAFKDYLGRLTSAQTANFNGQMHIKTHSSEGSNHQGNNSANSSFETTMNFNGKYNGQNEADERIELNLDGSLSYFGVSVNLKLALITTSESLYIKPENLGPLGALLGSQNLGDDWYEISMEEEEGAVTTGALGFADSECTNEDFATIKNYMKNEAKNKLEPTNLRRVSFFRETLDGHSVAHYSGTLTGERITQVIEELNQKVSEACRQNPNQLNDIRQVMINFDLWSGADFDRLKLVINGLKNYENLEITFDTQGYNQDIQIHPPAEAKPFESLFNFNSTQIPQLQPSELNSLPSPNSLRQ